MPHKRNPIGCEQIVGLARLVRANAMAALENVALWHERDISHSSVERVILPDSFIALDHMLRRFTRIVDGTGRASRSHAREPRAVARRDFFGPGAPRTGSPRHLARAGLRVGAAQRHARHSTSSKDFKALLLADRDVTKVLQPEEIEQAFDLDVQLRNVDRIFDRVFG